MGTPEVVVLGRPVIPGSLRQGLRPVRIDGSYCGRRCLRYGTKKDRDSTEQRNPCGGLRLSFRERANPSGGTAPVEPSVRLERISSQPGLLPQQHGIVNDFGRPNKNPDAYSRLFFP